MLTKKKQKSCLVILLASSLMACSTSDNSRQLMPLPTNLKAECDVDLPLLQSGQGVALATTLEWYQDTYTTCAANHNGLLKALKERGIQ